MKTFDEMFKDAENTVGWWKEGCELAHDRITALEAENDDLKNAIEGESALKSDLEVKVAELEAVVEAAWVVRHQPWFQVRSEGCAKQLSESLRQLDKAGKEAPDAD